MQNGKISWKHWITKIGIFETKKKKTTVGAEKWRKIDSEQKVIVKNLLFNNDGSTNQMNYSNTLLPFDPEQLKSFAS